MAVFGLGLGLQYPALSNLVTEAVPLTQAATGTALLAACSQLGAGAESVHRRADRREHAP